MRRICFFLCIIVTFTVLFGGVAVCSAESANTSYPFFTSEVNRMIDENYKLVQENGWAELRIPESVHGLRRDIFSPNAVDAAEKLINAGYEAYCIGGAVRDLVMGTPTMDFDIVTTAPNEEFEKILGDVTFHTIPSGQRFGYAHYPDEIIDVASCVNIPAAYKGFPGVPDFDPGALYSGSFVADSFQRDLTFNAIYYDFRTGDLVDYHGGLHDIREGVLNTMVDPYVAIEDDPRIAIRALRFAARYNFRLSDRMDAAMTEKGPEYVAKNQPDANKVNLSKYYDAGYARRCLDNLEKYNMFTAIYTPAADLYQTDAYKEYIRAATDWMDEWYADGKVMDGNLSIAAFLWPAVEGLAGEALRAAAKELFAAQQKTIKIDEEMEAKFLDIYDLQAKLTGEPTEEDAKKLLQHPHFMDAFELLMIRNKTNPGLNTFVQYWADLTEKQLSAALTEEAAESDSRIGIISAMENEVKLLISKTEIERTDTIGGVVFHVGTLCGQDVVISQSGMGKVLSAAATATMLNRYPVSHLLFTGVAGGVGEKTHVMDMVIGTKLVQHDYGNQNQDGFEWTSTYNDADGYYSCDPDLVTLAYEAAKEVVGEEHVFKGVIATGDRFVASPTYVKYLQDQFDALACEMEGASVAAVCEKFGIPYVIIRCMSDKADGKAHEAYDHFTDRAADNSGRIVVQMLEGLGGKQ